MVLLGVLLGAGLPLWLRAELFMELPLRTQPASGFPSLLFVYTASQGILQMFERANRCSHEPTSNAPRSLKPGFKHPHGQIQH